MKPIALIIFLIILSALTAFLTFQNIQPRKQTTDFSPSPTPTCTPRPACLDGRPRCLMPQTKDMCPYTCPSNGWADCMPGPDKDNRACSPEAMTWYKTNCANFQGGAY